MYFSEVFGVDPDVMEQENVFDVSLISDLPLFIDPFLIFQSSKPSYRKLHESIVRYVKFLQTKSIGGSIAPHQMQEWFHFKEVKQNWFGFSVGTNQGKGLKTTFAKGAIAGLIGPVKDFGSEAVSKGSHVERMFLFTGGTGKDGLSDFITNLCKEFLLEFTQEFAERHLADDQCKVMRIDRASFNYEIERWQEGTFRLPIHGTQYVLLTPSDLLTHAIPWINRPELFKKFGSIVESIDDGHLRGQVNDYLAQKLAPPPNHPPGKPFKPSKRDEIEAQEELLRRHPKIANWYVKEKESDGETAIKLSKAKVVRAADIYRTRVVQFVQQHLRPTGFFDTDVANLPQLQEKFCEAMQEGGESLFLTNGMLVEGLSSTDVDLVCTLAWKADGVLERRMPRFAFVAERSALTRLETKGFRSCSSSGMVVLTPSPSMANRIKWLCEADTITGVSSVCLCSTSEESEVESIFISYTGSDLAWAKWIGSCLLSAGYKVTSQYQDFVPGTNFVKEMDKAIQTTDRTVAVLSSDYLKSNFATIEWQAALREDPVGKTQKLVPIRVERVQPKGLLGSVVYADLVGLSEESATAVLLGALGASKRPSGFNSEFPGQKTVADKFSSIASKPPVIAASGQAGVEPGRRLRVAQTITSLSTDNINMLVFALAPPENELPPLNAAGKDRANHLLEWYLKTGKDFDDLEKLLSDLV